MSYKKKPLSLLLNLPGTEGHQATESLARGHLVLCARQPFLVGSSNLLGDSDERSPLRMSRRAGGLRLPSTEQKARAPLPG